MSEQELIKQSAAECSGRIMIAEGNGVVSEYRRRHVKVYDLSGRPYVRTGKRGQVKRWVSGHRVVCGAPLLVVFYTEVAE